MNINGLTKQKIKDILSNGRGYIAVDLNPVTGEVIDYHYDEECRSLKDLSEILQLREEIEKLKAEISKKKG